MTKEDVLSIVFNLPEWRMADYPFGDSKEATLQAMDEWAKIKSLQFSQFVQENGYELYDLFTQQNKQP